MSALQELAVRIAWSLSRIGEVLNEARTTGWLVGSPLESLVSSQTFTATFSSDPTIPMEVLRERFALSPVEMDALWILACTEVEPAIAAAAQMLASTGMHQLNIQVLAKLAGVRDEYGMFARLRGLGLIEADLDMRLPMYRRPIRATDRVIELARGHLALDARIASFARIDRPNSVSSNHDDAIARVLERREPSLLVATGLPGSGRSELFLKAAGHAGRALLVVDSAAFSTTERVEHDLVSIVRECRLLDLDPLLLDVEPDATRNQLLEETLLRHHQGPVLMTARQSGALQSKRPTLVFAVEIPVESERTDLWRSLLPDVPTDVPRACAHRYSVSSGVAREIATDAKLRARDPALVTAIHVQQAMRARHERMLDRFAKRVEVKQTWADLVLPRDQGLLVLEMVARIKHRELVLGDWGFAEKVGRGTGLTALLSGPPGTGKTMIAGLFARELGLDLFQVDLSRVVSKYIGETEKQLGALFDAAETGFAVLLFDEADSLFGKRTAVSSSNDRYANLEVNYLLQRVESFGGIILLTTNHEAAIDPAFQRRLAFHIRVPMPDERERAKMWRVMIPDRALRERELDTDQLAADFVMSGGYIKNAVLRAAYLAADHGTAITNQLLRRAAQTEYEAMGKLAYDRP